MSNLGFLFTAFALIWTALFFYLLYVVKKLSVVEKKIDALSEDN